MKDNNNLGKKSALQKILDNHCTNINGLLLLNPPTGLGKTHAVLSWIFNNYKDYCK